MKMFSMTTKDKVTGVEREVGPLTKIYAATCIVTGIMVVNNFIVTKVFDGVKYLDNKLANK